MDVIVSQAVCNSLKVEAPFGTTELTLGPEIVPTASMLPI